MKCISQKSLLWNLWTYRPCLGERSLTGILWAGPLEGKSWAWRFCPSHCRHVGSTCKRNMNSLAVFHTYAYRSHDGRHNKRYLDTYKERTHLLFNLLERRLVVMRSSDAHFTFLRLLFNSSNYCIYRRAVSLNTTHTFPLSHYNTRT